MMIDYKFLKDEHFNCVRIYANEFPEGTMYCVYLGSHTIYNGNDMDEAFELSNRLVEAINK